MMAKWWRALLDSPRLAWPAVALLALLNGVGIYMLASDYAADKARAAQHRAAQISAAAEAAKPKVPPPPAMIHPPAVEAMLRSGTLIVISKKSQNMFVFSNGALWASTPISTGKRRHETPAGVFPILQKRKFHRSNLYSNAPMPFMQRLTWDGIALHAGRVPGYAASHGCIRMPHVFAQSLFKLTNMTATTVVIGDDPLETEVHAQQFALTQSLPVRSALAPVAAPPVVKPPVELAGAATTQSAIVPIRAAPPPPPPVAAPASLPQSVSGQTIQLTAAPSQAEAEAHWARLLKDRPDMRRFAKSVEAAEVKSRRVYRLRISGPDAHSYCKKLQSEGINCLNVG
jgi:L,D-transpeptidase catalytic domain/SPOR domain